MSQDKELEIQLQFLEEAQEYLDTIESVLLGLAGGHIDGQKIDAVLRAAHSVKGGAGMMGFQVLSQLAHRLEDSFKVLKAQRNSIELDAELESLLLAAVDRLRQVLATNRQQSDVDEQWLATVGNPVFDKLHDRLGDPVADDASTILGPEEGTNVAALLFETEVEGCLNRLETVLDDPQAPCLEEELSIMAQELEGLGEMLQLSAFSSLCQSVMQRLTVAPDRVKETAQLALQAWRRSQALVLVGQVNSLPTQIDGVGDARVSATQAATEPTPTEVVEESWIPAELAEENWIPAELAEENWTPAEAAEESWQDLEVFAAEFDNYSSESESVEQTTAAEFDSYSSESESVEQTTDDDVLEEEFAASSWNSSLVREVQAVSEDDSGAWVAPLRHTEDYAARTQTPRFTNDVPTATNKWREVETPRRSVNDSASSTQTKETQENTVRIPVRQLDRLSDLFGELTIERNGLSLHLKRLRSMMETLSSRVSALEKSNLRLRTAYDTVATQAGAVPAVFASLVAATTPNIWKSSPKTSREVLPGKDDPAGRLYYNDYFFDTFNDDDGEAEQGSRDVPAEHFYDESPEDISSRFDSLEMDRYSDLHLLSMEVMETIVQIQEVTSDIELGLEDTDQMARELNRTAKQLQTNLTRVRMRPLSDLVGRFSRALRDLSLQYGKQVELKVLGRGTLIDRSILEALNDPLMHLVRNAFDHGIEKPEVRKAQGKPPKGTIEIKAAHRGNQTLITVSDDGNGINLDKIRARAEEMGLDAELLAAASEEDLLSLIFEPGFSTAEQVTALSGRGVGMDVVRNNLREIRGDIRVDTSPGRGTTFTLTVPFTLSVARILLVESNGMLLAFPTDVIEEMLLLHPDMVLKTPGSEVLKWEEEMIPLIRLGAWLKFNCPRKITIPEGTPSIGEPTVMMINHGDQLVGLQVDRCWGEQEVAIRQVEGTLAMPSGFSSCAILGDGKVIPLVDASELLRWISSFDSAMRSDGASELGRTTSAHHQRNSVERGSAQLSPSKDTIDDVLVDLQPDYSAQLAPPQAHPMVQHEANQEFDIISADDPPVLPVSQGQKDTILVVDDSINVRRFLALALEKAGYLVEQAKDGQDAVEKLLGGLQVQAVICDIEMPRLDGYGFLARIKSDPAFNELPIAMLTSRSGNKHRQLAMTLGATAYFSKPYNERALLRTLKQLISSKLTA